MQRNFNLLSPLPPTDLRFVSMKGTEAVSQLFALTLNLQSPRKDINPNDLLGQPMSVAITLPDGGVRHINGQCTQFSSAAKSGRHYAYMATGETTSVAYTELTHEEYEAYRHSRQGRSLELPPQPAEKMGNTIGTITFTPAPSGKRAEYANPPEPEPPESNEKPNEQLQALIDQRK